MDVRLLGPLEVRLGDGPVDLGPRKQRAVLAMLALEPGRTVSADRLAEGLWGDRLPPSAAKMVQLYVSHLRRVLDGDGVRIVTHGRGYELQLVDGEVDAVRAERLLEQARPREALALWRGEPLAELADEPFAADAIRRLEELRLRAAELAIDADLSAGRHADVIAELDALVAANPLRERLHAQRMLALYRANRQSEALAAYHTARAELVEQIGVEPGAELQHLHEQILAHDPALDLPAAAEPVPVTAPQAPPRRRSRAALVGAAALMLAGVLAFGLIRVLEPDGLSGIDENFVGLIDPDGGRITKQAQIGERPTAAVSGEGAVWIANGADGTVTRIDHSGHQTVTIPTGGAPAALALGGGSLWVADSDSRNVLQVDPGSNKVVQAFEVGNAPRALAAAAGKVWVASGVDGRIRSIDRGRLARPIALGVNPSALAAGAGALWVASEEAGTVTRVEPRTGSVVRAITVGNGPSALAAGEGAVWVVNRLDGTLSRIDPQRNAVSWSVPVGRDPHAVAVGEGAVWVAGGEEGTLIRVDPDRRDVKRFRTGSSPAALAVAGGSVWAATEATRAAHRGGTLRALSPRAIGALVPIDWLHPAAYTTWATAQFGSLAYDGLVGYRRVEGAAGATLVGALATDVPPPSADGRTYVFTLRRGLRFSDGRPVRPADVRASMERYLQVTRHRSPEESFPPFYAAIVGARACMTGHARCDLARGMQTDERARTLTVRLTRPDADFLPKLAMSFASVVPADSPRRATTGPPPPGTGPYRVIAWDSKRGGTFVRNPHFRPTRSRADGYPDRIEVGVFEEPTVEKRIRAVQRGAADVTVIANPFNSPVSARRLRALSAQAPGRVHSDPALTSEWMFLNVRRRPFDDPRVRKAVNFAVDRQRVVELAGGEEVGGPTCQILPRAFPGYEPYCPYSARPAPGRGWTAPDMERARRLVAASGRVGDRVVVHMPDFDYKVRLARYYARLLRELGFRTTLRIQSFDAYDVYDANTRASTGEAQWGADYLAPANFIQPNFGCGAASNASRLCDRTLDRRAARALEAPPADAAAAWARADRRVVDLAAAVPLTNRRSVVLVSKRVGNVRSHPLLFTLLDQMWVR